MVTCYLSEQCPTVWQSLEFICPMDYTVKVNYNSDQEEFKVQSTKINLGAKWLLGYFTRVCLGGSNELFPDTPLLQLGSVVMSVNQFLTDYKDRNKCETSHMNV